MVWIDALFAFDCFNRGFANLRDTTERFKAVSVFCGLYNLQRLPNL